MLIASSVHPDRMHGSVNLRLGLPSLGRCGIETSTQKKSEAGNIREHSKRNNRDSRDNRLGSCENRRNWLSCRATMYLEVNGRLHCFTCRHKGKVYRGVESS